MRGRGYDPTPITLPPLREGKVGGKAEGCGVRLAGTTPLRGSTLAFHSSTGAPWDPRELENPVPHLCTTPNPLPSRLLPFQVYSHQLQDLGELGLCV